MATFVTSKSTAYRHGVYAIERQPAATIRATGTGQCAIVAQFPWGPDQTLTQPTSMKQLLDMVAPAGMSRTGSGYLSLIRKGFPIAPLFVRVTNSGAKLAATCPINKAGPTLMLTLTLKYVGAAGNSVTATTSAASDGNANHFNLLISVSSAYGVTTDLFQNLNYSGTGADSTPDFTNTLLIGSITKNSSGVPLLATTSFTGGNDGVVVAADYVGTQGAADKGIALFEKSRIVDHFFSDDPGNAMRTVVNAGLIAHADYMTDRIAYINGPQGQTLAQVQTDVASYSPSQRGCYVDAWGYILDDQDGTKRIVPSAPFAAAVAAQLPASTSIAWKGQPVQVMLSGLVDLEADRGDAVYTNTAAGITTLMKEVTGGFTFEAAVNMANAASPAKGTLNRTRMGHYMARSMVQSLRPQVDAPNVPAIQQDEIIAVDTFLGNLKQNAKTDPLNLVHILDYSIHDVKSANAQSDLDNGDFTIEMDIKTSSGQSRIFLGMNYGETTKVNVTL